MVKNNFRKEFDRYIGTIEKAKESPSGIKSFDCFQKDALKPFSPYMRKLISDEMKGQSLKNGSSHG